MCNRQKKRAENRWRRSAPRSAQPRQWKSCDEVALDNANQRRGNSSSRDRDGRSPTRYLQRPDGAVVTTKRSGVVTTATRQQSRGPAVGFRSDSRGFGAQTACTDDLYAATAFKVAGRSSLAQANRTAKQTLNHCNSDSRTVQCRNDRQGHRFVVEVTDLRSSRSIRACAHLPIDVERFAFGDARQFINPAAPSHDPKEVFLPRKPRSK